MVRASIAIAIAIAIATAGADVREFEDAAVMQSLSSSLGAVAAK